VEPKKVLASQGEAKQPALTSDSEATSTPPPKPTLPVKMEVDTPGTKEKNSEEPEQSTCQAPPNQTTVTEMSSDDAWLEVPGLSFEGLPEMEYERLFFTPVGSPNRT